MMSECIMKKSKGVIMEPGECLGVMTRSKIRALQLGGQRGKQLGVVGVKGGEVKKRVKKGGCSKVKVKKGGGRKIKKKVEKKVEEKEDEEMEESGDLGGIGGGGSAEVGDVGGVGGGDSVIGCSGGTAFGGVFVDGTFITAGGDAGVIAGGGDAVSGGVAKGGEDGTAAISGGGGGEGGELGGDVAGGNDDRVIRESTPEHLIIKSDYITTPCSSMKDAKAVADERPQTEVGENEHQHMKLTTDLLLQDNSNYAPSMEKYNFDFENEKPLFGRYEWEKVQP